MGTTDGPRRGVGWRDGAQRARAIPADARARFPTSRSAEARSSTSRASTAGVCFPNLAAYNTSKAALDQLTRCAAIDWAPHGVRVNAVNPGVTVTNLHRRSGMTEDAYAAFLARSKETHPLGRPGTGLRDRRAHPVPGVGPGGLGDRRDHRYRRWPTFDVRAMRRAGGQLARVSPVSVDARTSPNLGSRSCRFAKTAVSLVSRSAAGIGRFLALDRVPTPPAHVCPLTPRGLHAARYRGGRRRPRTARFGAARPRRDPMCRRTPGSAADRAGADFVPHRGGRPRRSRAAPGPGRRPAIRADVGRLLAPARKRARRPFRCSCPRRFTRWSRRSLLVIGSLGLTNADERTDLIEPESTAGSTGVPRSARPGGGGGGGGMKMPTPPPKAQRKGPQKVSSPIPARRMPPPVRPAAQAVEPPPPPLEAKTLPPVMAPVAPVAADSAIRKGSSRKSRKKRRRVRARERRGRRHRQGHGDWRRQRRRHWAGRRRRHRRRPVSARQRRRAAATAEGGARRLHRRSAPRQHRRRSCSGDRRRARRHGRRCARPAAAGSGTRSTGGRRPSGSGGFAPARLKGIAGRCRCRGRGRIQVEIAMDIFCSLSLSSRWSSHS